MKFPNALKAPLMDAADTLMGLWPRLRPTADRLKNVRVVAHRGYCGGGAKENTLESFRAALKHRTWGIEFDLRWTSDGTPMVHHDASTLRVFDVDCDIASLSESECRKRFPLIPSFEELVSEFGRKAHLMIEIKDSVVGNQKRLDSIAQVLKDLEPVRDYHMMCLRPADLLACKFAPRTALLPIAEFNVATLSRIALQEGMGGLTAQYVLLDRATIRRHHEAGQKIGTGFCTSHSVFRREVNRDVDWIFTNHTAEVMAWAALG